MRLLLINQFFWPDSAPTGMLAADVARELAERGHSVTVLCGGNGYCKRKESDRPPVEIVHVANTPFCRTTGGRLLSWTSFLGVALLRSARLPRFDLVITMTTPPGLALIGVLLKRLRQSRFWIWEMDLYPDVAGATMKLQANSGLYRWSAKVIDWARAQADQIIVLGQCMKSRLIGHGLPEERISICENWADGTEIRPVAPPPSPPLTIMYSGNLGLAHETETISQVMLAFREDPRLRFVFVGGGASRSKIERFCQLNQVSRVEFWPYCEKDRLSENLGSCHIGLVTLNDGCQGTVVPSKVYSLMAAGRPVLFIGPPDSTSALTVNKHACGWQISPGDVKGAVALLESLVRFPRLISDAGTRAREAFSRYYDRSQGVARVADLLEESVHTPVRIPAVLTQSAGRQEQLRCALSVEEPNAAGRSLQGAG